MQENCPRALVAPSMGKSGEVFGEDQVFESTAAMMFQDPRTLTKFALV